MEISPDSPSPGGAMDAPDGAVGLSADEARRRLADVGPNELERARGPSRLRILAGQFASPLIWLLLGASIVSAVLGEVADAVAIGAILAINGVIGFFQEYRAEQAVLALRSMTAPRARVMRDGRAAVIPAAEIVPGDLLLLEAGDLIAADARVLEAHALAANEAPLTGESAPVAKRPEPVPEGTPLAERHDSVFLGTALVTGTGRARVVTTGARTELGRIAHLLASAKESETPLEGRLRRISRSLLFACLGVVAAVAVLGLARGQPVLDVFLVAVSLAVAAVPEGLPAVVTIALAIGVQRMASRNVLVRKLPAVETLGSTTVICTDKTGTLTTGVMTVRELWGPDQSALLAAAAACCEAELDLSGRAGTGDPTEIAILVAAAERGVHKAEIEAGNRRVAVHPFDSDRKWMAIERADGVVYVKGAIEAVTKRADGGAAPEAQAAASEMAARGLRVLAVATGTRPEVQGLRLTGLIGMADPPRPEAIRAVADARRAGIRTVMITGDHPLTARAIAREMGISGGAAGDGDGATAPADADLSELIHARATPEDKLTIVRGWKARGAVVAMTGDGVNDAPALREAHVGIAMGRGGTEVTREASDMILGDDNFASIVAAVREGRGIFDNIRKSLVYLLSGNAGELAVMLGASVVGLPIPLSPLQILWINLVTDALPAIALVMDPADADILDRPPRPPAEPMLGRAEWGLIVALGLCIAALALGLFVWGLRDRTLVEARALAFSALVFAQVFLPFGFRSRTRLFWEVGIFTNSRLVGVAALSVGLQVGLLYLPVTRDLFQIGRLPRADLALAALAGLVPLVLLESSKLARRLARSLLSFRA